MFRSCAGVSSFAAVDSARCLCSACSLTFCCGDGDDGGGGDVKPDFDVGGYLPKRINKREARARAPDAELIGARPAL